MFLQLDVTWAAECSGNCHWFAWGHWDHYAVEAMLDGYHEVREPEPGDKVLYRDGNGRLRHSGIYVGNGLVRSKWGNAPPALHDIGTCMYPTEDVRFYALRPK